jgi:hypothetical protein
MRTIGSLLLLTAAWTLCSLSSRGDDRKEETLKGTILCARCALKETKKCQTAIQIKEGERTITYYFDDKGNKEEHHEPVCGGDRKEGTVTGTVQERDGKKYVKPSKVDYGKK